MSRRKIYGIPEGMTVSQLSELIDENVFDEKIRRILKRRFIDNLTYEMLASEFGMSINGVRNIVIKYGDKFLLKIRYDE